MTTYKIGDRVKVLVDDIPDLTKNKVYAVVNVGNISVTIRDDVGDRHAIIFGSVKLVGLTHIPVGYPPNMKEDKDEPTYDEVKAAAPVTSAGIFKQGDVVVYRDGTVTKETRTVTQCTATCVWFEETWSQPFNPNEFTVEDYY